MNLSILLLGCLSFVISLSSAYRIFALFPINGRSHFSILEQVAKGLAEKGHQVDVISSFPLKDPFPNYTDIFTSPMAGTHISIHYGQVQSRSQRIQFGHEYLRKMCNDTLGDPRLLNIIRKPPSNPPYDAVLIQFMNGYQCFSAIGHLWNVPVVGIVTTALQPYLYDFIGNPLNLAITPKNLQSYKENMNFWDRLYNFVTTHYYIHEYHHYAWLQDEIIRKYFGPSVPHYTELGKEVSLILTNSHPSLYGIQPKTPAHVEIGGIHIQNDNSTMDLELKRLLDESKNGFIYFSFGTVTVLESLPQKILERFFVTFRHVSPVRVIMKSKNSTALPPNVPENVFTFPWLPQQKILQHSNIKGFVSHGGGLGSQEAVYFGVPVICFPLFDDQFMNCDIPSEKGYGMKVDITTAQQKDYDDAFHQILTNPKYQTSARRLSLLYRDRPIKPKDDAVYWIEYVIRHGKNALMSPAMNLDWWLVELLDIYAFIVATCASTMGVIFLVIRGVFRLISLLQTNLSKQHCTKKSQ